MHVEHKPNKKDQAEKDKELATAREVMANGPAPDLDKPTLPSQIEDESIRLAVARKLLASEKNRVAVRGFEVARLNPNGDWESVMRGKLPYMVSTAMWLNERHPNTLYQARVIVSVEIPDRPVDMPKDALTELAQKMGVEETDEAPPISPITAEDFDLQASSEFPESTPEATEEAPSVPWKVE